MKVRKVRGQNKIGKIVLSPTEVAMAKKLGLSIQVYARETLIFIAKKRKWDWFFGRQK